MIVGQPKIQLSGLDRVRRSNWQFYPTGSRHFGEYSSESDWDFFAVFSREIVAWLGNNGFFLNGVSYGDKKIADCHDPTIHSVWSYTLGTPTRNRPYPLQEDQVHIQLIKPDIYMEAKLKAQQILSGVSYFKHLSKDHRQKIWCVLQTALLQNPNGSNSLV